MQILITHGTLARTRVLHFNRWQLAGMLIGLVAAALIEASWWIQGRVLQEPRLLWRAAD